ncbi:MAG: twin-arginine translocase subunit TatC [Candidatus Eisenbacteria bacterium]
MDDSDGKSMSFLGHLEELRWTIVWIAAATLVGTAVAWYFSGDVLNLLSNDLSDVLERVLGPGEGYKLHVFEVAEAFTTKLKISLLIGFLIALPFNIVKVWQFVSPGLFRSEKKMAGPLVLMSIVLFYCGVLFAYQLMVKLSVAFLFRLKPPSVVATVRMGSYISFVIKFCITFGLVFQVPLVLAVLAWMGLVSSGTLKQGWRYAFVAVLVLAAVLTPPDVVSQILMTVPMLALYWVGYLLARVFEKRRRG